MTTHRSPGRTAVTHYEVRERIDSPYGKFAILDVHIETGRTHQIRVHMASVGHPVVGDTLYGAPGVLWASVRTQRRKGRQRLSSGASTELRLNRNFLHAAAIDFTHPRTGKLLSFAASLPEELIEFLDRLKPDSQL